MMKVVLLDDEKPALRVLGRFIGDRNDVQVVGAYTDPTEMLNDVKELMPDLIFMDIEIPEMNGLEIAARLREIQENTEVVFVTAYRQYALEAFRVSAVDYLLKPIDPEMLHHTLDRILKRRVRRTVGTETGSSPGIRCFGGFDITKKTQVPVHFPTAKAEELFAYMLVHRNTTISKWTICDNLWPDISSPENVMHKLHVTMHRMKKTLQEAGIQVRISSLKGYYQMECEESCDYFQFEQRVSRELSADQGNPEALMKMLGLYKGPLFAHRDYPWCEEERERMFRYFATASKRVAKWYQERMQYPQASEVLHALILHDPIDEEAHEMLLRMYLNLQDKHSFLAHYEKVKKTYSEELGTFPPEILSSMADSLR
ncbi:response regulator [Paenibacillus barengoltzii]|uniref:response regulator n=1 Tax=Paenibacillus barengoltzii TaxID=343517 RepID=UPI002DB911A8|nr:response regulator [Paenibacillus barengoltzii]MEC2343100.1 response regulator [Paenibacillus barengoltzii]